MTDMPQRRRRPCARRRMPRGAARYAGGRGRPRPAGAAHRRGWRRRMARPRRRAPAARQDAQEPRGRPAPARGGRGRASRSARSARPRCSPPAGSTTCSSPIRAPARRRRSIGCGASRARAPAAVGVDSVDGARAVAAALGPRSGRVARSSIEIDSGGARTGVRAGRRRRAGAPTRPTCGLDGRRACSPTAATATPARWRASAAADDEVGWPRRRRPTALAAEASSRVVVSAGSTPTAVASARGVGDRGAPGHVRLRRSPAGGARRRSAATRSRRSSRRRSSASTAGERRFVIDAGAKILGKDVAPYLDGHGEIPELGERGRRARRSTTTASSSVPAGRRAAGGRARSSSVVPNHICPVVNLVDEFVVARWTVGSSTGGRSTPAGGNG